MKDTYIRIPLRFGDFFPTGAGQGSPGKPATGTMERTSSKKDSLDEFIELLITTHFGEYINDCKFGFEIWEREFVNIQIEKFNTHNYPRQDLERSLKETIQKYEPRIRDVGVDILFVFRKDFKGKKVKYFVEITVRGTMENKTADPYVKSFQFAMGPIFK